MVCGSENILLWLGESIGTLYHCTDCQYIAPVILKNVEEFAEPRVGSKSKLRAGNFWSETGIGNQSIFKI